MPRTARASVGGICYHVLNRGNGRQQVFFKDGDYAAFLKALTHACDQIPMRVLAYCLMPNHFHLVVWPREDGDLSAWMHWLSNAHVRRYHQHYKGSGHLWQGRFKAFPIEQDEHLLTVLSYVERNPLRANLVESVEQWTWSSAPARFDLVPRPPWLDEGPVALPADCRRWLEQPATESELAACRRSVDRGAPFGSPAWQKTTAESLGLNATLRPRGRPRKAVE